MTAKRIFAGIGVLLLSGMLGLSVALADTLNIKGDAPERYTVVKGDTLWDISAKYLEKPWRWPELWEGNPQIVNPHLIFPGDVISLSYVDGQPRLGINRARPDMKLEPQIRSTPVDDAIPVIPVEVLRPLLLKLDILDKATMDKAPHVIQGQESRLIMTKGDRIYVVGVDGGKRDKKYQVYNLGAPIKDPVSQKVIAYEGIFVGDAEMQVPGDPATLLMTSSKQEVSVGDRLVETKEEKALSNVHPKIPEGKVNGQILNVIGGVGLMGRYQTVVINLGKKDGIEQGHVLSVFTKGEVVPDNVSEKLGDYVTLPDDRAGTLLVVDAYEQLSYALIVESRLPIRTLDTVRTPE